jgi:microcystin-dependent protein
LATKQYVDALWTTGDVKVTLKMVADSGWVMFDDGTIGNASSGATTRANADTQALFILLWTNTVDADCAVSGGRGGTAAADFAANKTIALPKVLGRALAVAGTGSGLTSRALAHVLGSENAIVVSHTHGVTDPGHSHVEHSTDGIGASPGVQSVSDDSGAGGVTTGVITATATTGLSVNSTGSSGTGANMPPTSYLNIMVKL